LNNTPISISIVIPVYNEEDNIESLHHEIRTVCEKERYIYEIIIIDDGSFDKTPEIAKRLSPVTLLKFRKNYGQTSAFDAGIKHANNELIITMDGDGQNDPADIPRLIEYLKKENLDIVSGWRKNRHDPISKKLISRAANYFRYLLIHDGINDSGCSLKAYRRLCFQNLTLYGEMHRFIPALLKIKGFKIGEIEVNHRPRKGGVSKYDWKRTLKGFVDIISVWFWTKYAVRPLHLLGGGGLFMIGIGILLAFYTTYLYIVGHNLSDTMEPLLTAFFLFMGVQFFISGLIADMLSKTYYEKTKDTPYNIDTIVINPRVITENDSQPKPSEQS